MRRILLAAAAALIGFVPAVRAEFPERPVTMIMPYAPGAADALMRAVGEHFQRATGQPLVLQTRDGASGVVGMRVVAGAAAGRRRWWPAKACKRFGVMCLVMLRMPTSSASCAFQPA